MSKKSISWVLAIAMVLSLFASLPITVYAQPEEYICEIGEAKYETLDDALIEVQDRETIRLLAGFTHSNSIIADNKVLSIDLNGYDLTVENVAGHALEAKNEGILNITDDDGSGVLTVNSSGEFKHCVNAVSGGTVNIKGNLTASIPAGAMSYQNIIGAYADGPGSTINLVGGATGHMAGIYAQNGAVITVTGNVSGSYYGAYAAYDGLVDVTGDIIAGTNGLTVEYGGMAEIEGNITGGTGIYVNNTTSFDAPKAVIIGNVVSTGVCAINASNHANIDITGNLDGYIIASGTDTTTPEITINGNITVSSGFGVNIYYGGTVTVNGAITGANPYLKLNNLDISKGSGTVSEGYYVYSNNTPSAFEENPDLVNTVKVKIPESTAVVSLLEIADAIAPINGEAPVTWISATDQYTGTVAWAGNPSQFSPGQMYTATITLTAKEGYTFNGIAANAFKILCANSATNDADSGVITAAFISPPTGYITDGRGVMAYRYYYSNFDIIGFFYDGWKQTTYSNYGFRTDYKVGDGELRSISATGTPDTLGDTGLTMDVDLAFVSDGRALQVRYTIENTGNESANISFGSHADIQIGRDDYAPISIFDDSLAVPENRGFKMVSRIDNNQYNEYAQFNFFGKRSVGVTDVDTFWYGGYSSRYENLLNQVMYTSYSGDSGMAFSWQNRIIGSGVSQVYTVVIGIGGAESSEVLGYSVAYDDNAPDAVIDVPETQQKIENIALALSEQIPVRSGYVFDSWNTQANGEGTRYNPGDIYTANANLTLYAQWREATPSTYTLTVNLKGGNGGTASGSYSEGAVIPIDAGTRSGYIFNGWTSSNGGSFEDAASVSTNFTMPANDTTITANWRTAGGGYKYYTITASAGAGGSIAPSGDVSVREGSDRTFNITPEKGHIILDVVVDGKSVGTVNRYKFEDIRRSHKIKAVFRAETEPTPDLSSDNPFYDVTENDWFFNPVLYAYHKGLLLGTGANTFNPNGDTTRAMIATILYRMERSPEGPEKFLFSDVEQGLWYSDAVSWSEQNEIVFGIGNNLFAPDLQITREQLAAMLYRYAGYKSWDVSARGDLSFFRDKDEVSLWALETVKWAVGAGLMNGKGGGILDPQGPATRAEVATILMNFMQKYNPDFTPSSK